MAIFYAEVLTRKFDLQSFFTNETGNTWKNPQFKFSSQNLSIECKFLHWYNREKEDLGTLCRKIFFKTLPALLVKGITFFGHLYLWPEKFWANPWRTCLQISKWKEKCFSSIEKSPNPRMKTTMHFCGFFLYHSSEIRYVWSN